jgi:anti-sigma factor RsiW
MTDSPDSVRKAELHAYVDGLLDPERRRAVAAYIAAHPEAARRVAAYERQKKALRALLDPVLEEALPRELRPPGAMRRRLHLAWAAAAAVLMVVGGAIGWQLRDLMQDGALADSDVPRLAAVAHTVFAPQRRHPVEVAANEEAHLVAWLSKVIGAPLRAPRLADLGYALVGGRLLSAPEGPAAQFMYEDAKNRRITLYVVRNPLWQGKAEFRFAERRGVSVFYWIEGPLGYALTAEMERPELFEVARAVHQQVER